MRLGQFVEFHETSAALQKSELHFREMFERAPVPMAIADANQDIIAYNKEFTQNFGYTTDDVNTAEQWWLAIYPDPEYRRHVEESWALATYA